jgi:5-methylcytosine-specific restriction endonuclease McrA
MSQTCQSPIQQGPRKGSLCGNKTTDIYCVKHARQAVHDQASTENIRYCDISRGCYTVLEEHQSKCVQCLHKARIHNRKRNDKKRQDETLCLDCGNKLTDKVRAKGKHDRPLRRCIPCYEKLLKIEKERAPRERNYKTEAFTNKHVIWNHYVKGAKKRGISFELPKTQFEALIIQPCFYCTHFREGEVNGIDRLDNHKGYVDENVVPCCESCNLAKGTQHPQEFVDKLLAIHRYRTEGSPITGETVEKWKTTYLSKTIPSYRTYQKSAATRNLLFSLTEDQFAHIIESPCYLCGLRVSDINRNGIDRVNNRLGYLMENAKSCCGHCNLLKKTMELEELYRIASKVSERQADIGEILSVGVFTVRVSKSAPRPKQTDTLIVQEAIPMTYKPLEEDICDEKEIPAVVASLLAKKVLPPSPPKQWKAKQIHHAFQTGQEHAYKLHCEQHNDLSLHPTWSADWDTFAQSVRGRPESATLPLITAFVENLRRVRHNRLCLEKNLDVVDKEDRQQWPATTVVRAFLDGKLDRFKTFTEASTEEDPADPKWNKRWTGFVASLEDARDQPDVLKTLCSKFMTAQRAKKYRHRLASGTDIKKE